MSVEPFFWFKPVICEVERGGEDKTCLLEFPILKVSNELSGIVLFFF